MKPKTNRRGDKKKSSTIDQCQTPPYALDLILPYLPEGATIWEPAAGHGMLAEALQLHGFRVVAGDLLTGQNFFEYEPPVWDVLVTNPPYSIKYDWLERCYALCKPFALLMPIEMLVTRATNWFMEHGIEVVAPNKRINFHMPNKGFDGGGAQFPTAWYTWGLNIGATLTFRQIVRNPTGQLSLFPEKNTVHPSPLANP